MVLPANASAGVTLPPGQATKLAPGESGSEPAGDVGVAVAVGVFAAFGVGEFVADGTGVFVAFAFGVEAGGLGGIGGVGCEEPPEVEVEGDGGVAAEINRRRKAGDSSEKPEISRVVLSSRS